MSHGHATRLLIFARAPVAGEVKTRLIPALGAQGAARLHQQLMVRLIEHLGAARLAPIELWVTPGASHPCFTQLARRWSLSLHVQQGDDLGQRLSHAARCALTRAESVILIGTDCPEMSADYLGEAIRALHDHDAVLGPALDGGYVLLGFKHLADQLFEHMPWGGDQVAELTAQRLDRLGWSWSRLRPLRDIDRPEDLVHLPAEHLVGVIPRLQTWGQADV